MSLKIRRTMFLYYRKITDLLKNCEKAGRVKRFYPTENWMTSGCLTSVIVWEIAGTVLHKVLSNWKLVEFRMLDLSDCMRNGLNRSSEGYLSYIELVELKMLDFSDLMRNGLNRCSEGFFIQHKTGWNQDAWLKWLYEEHIKPQFWKVFILHKLVELKMLDFCDLMWTNLSISK